MPKEFEDYITADVHIEYDRPKSILVQNLNNIKIWVPKSLCKSIELHHPEKGGLGSATIQIPEWLAMKNDLI